MAKTFKIMRQRDAKRKRGNWICQVCSPKTTTTTTTFIRR